MKKIEILGGGCAKCKRLKKNVEKAVKELGIEAEINEISDIEEIMERGVMMTPAMFIEDEKKTVGKIPSVNEIKEMLKQ